MARTASPPNGVVIPLETWLANPPVWAADAMPVVYRAINRAVRGREWATPVDGVRHYSGVPCNPGLPGVPQVVPLPSRTEQVGCVSEE